MVEYEIKITGRVQGVGFRYFVQRRAAEFNIVGWVKNERDGSVLVRAQGQEKDVETFLEHLKIGPSMARVIKTEKREMPGLEVFTDFRIRY
jgi:acylphosphatase